MLSTRVRRPATARPAYTDVPIGTVTVPSAVPRRAAGDCAAAIVAPVRVSRNHTGAPAAGAAALVGLAAVRLPEQNFGADGGGVHEEAGAAGAARERLARMMTPARSCPV